MITSTRRAAQDLLAGALSPQIWLQLAWSDLEARYRRTILGTFWQTLTMAAYIVGIAVVFSTLRARDAHDFLLYVATGFAGFSLISGLLVSGASTFQRGEALLKAYDLPASIHVFRVALNEFILFAHALVIILGVWIYTGTVPTLMTLLVIPALALMFLLGVGICLCMGLLGARFRDVNPAISTLMSFMFLVTPIFWMRSDLGDKLWVVDANPIYHVVNLIRAPLMGHAPDPINWIVCGSVAALSLLIGLVGFINYRRLLVYWL